MDFNQVKELINIIEASSLVDFNIDFENTRISMKKAGGAATSGQNIAEIIHKAQDAQPKIEDIRGIIDKPTTIIPQPKPVMHEGNVVTAPLVGTFYECAAPGKPSFVTAGSKVKKGDVLCIIEAMKIMNEITSKFDGTVAEILVNNEDMVEYGQELFIIV